MIEIQELSQGGGKVPDERGTDHEADVQTSRKLLIQVF